jgi:DNA-binding winged helix-turn-helix (wHTH) protein/tRNA A-37 threonylcarbamoyl transferase component Bud32
VCSSDLKPFSISELLARANAFLRRHRTGTVSEYVFGDLRLDLSAHRLTRNGEETTLTPKEFQLLEYLISRAGRALTRDDIMDRVWSGVFVTGRSVDRCITTLRGKIEPDARNPTYIRTIRDVGYRFEQPEDRADTAASPEGPGAVLRSDPDAPLAAGTCLGRFEIIDLIGRGGMAEVYRARDSRLERDVAIKVLARRLADQHEVLQRFERETKAVAALSHPNVLAIYDVGTEDDLAFAVTELLEGETLRARLKHSPLPWSEARSIALAAADGLAAAHEKGIVHRDVKPENIFLTTTDVVKLLDFGLARLEEPARFPLADGSMSFETSRGTILGTIDYMAPEQLRGEAVDGRTDVFSLGCVLFEMLTGRCPFKRDTPADTMAAILTEDSPELRSKDAPRRTNGVLSRCLAKPSADRWPSAQALADALRQLG